MYRNYWGLRESPFRGAVDPRYFYQSPTHEEALARLQFLAEDGRRVGLLMGGSGSGKSLMLEVFARQLRRTGCDLVNLSLIGTDLHEFLWLVAADLGVNPDRRADIFTLWRGISDRLIENRYRRLPTVMLLDDVGQASPDVLEHIVRLLQQTASSAAPLTVVLAVNPLRVHQLGQRLLELAELRIDIEPWEEIDSAGYIANALEQAGRNDALFSDDAIARLHHLAAGVPRQVNQLANLSLLAGAGAGVEQINSDIVENVYHELGVVTAVA